MCESKNYYGGQEKNIKEFYIIIIVDNKNLLIFKIIFKIILYKCIQLHAINTISKGHDSNIEIFQINQTLFTSAKQSIFATFLRGNIMI